VRILQRIQNKHWLNESWYSLLNRLTDFFLGALVFLMLVRAFPRADFGTWSLLVAIGVVLDNTRSGLLQNAVIRYLNHRKLNKQQYIFETAFFLNLTISAVIFLLLWWGGTTAANLFNAPDLAELTPILGLTFLINAPLLQLSFYQWAQLEMKAFFWIQLLRSGSFLLLVAALYFFDGDLTLQTLAWTQLASFFLATLVGFFYNLKQSLPRPYFHQTALFRLFHFGKFVLVTNILSSIKYNADRFLLGAILGPVSVGISNVAFKFLNAFEVPQQALAMVYYSRSTKNQAQTKDYLKRQFMRTVSIILIMSIPVAIVVGLAAPWLVNFFAGSDYQAAIPYLQLVLWSVILKPFDKISGNFLDSRGRPDQNFKSVIISFVLSMPIYAFSVYYAGLMGAAFGYVASIAISCLIKMFFVRQHFDLGWWDILIFWKKKSDDFRI
jgi:O-antigen/teichoic acid export membrane protein